MTGQGAQPSALSEHGGRGRTAARGVVQRLLGCTACPDTAPPSLSRTRIAVGRLSLVNHGAERI
jgi:hypothetical protein